MPSLDLVDARITPKSLQRNIDRSRHIVNWHSATYHKEVLPRIRKLALSIWRDAMREPDGELRCKMAKTFLDLSEMRRSLLGFPSPGRRKDESATGSSSNGRAAPGIIDIAEAAARESSSSANVVTSSSNGAADPGATAPAIDSAS